MECLLGQEMAQATAAVSGCSRCDLADPNICLGSKRNSFQLVEVACCRWYSQQTHSSPDDHWGPTPNMPLDINRSDDCRLWAPLTEKQRDQPKLRRMA